MGLFERILPKKKEDLQDVSEQMEETVPVKQADSEANETEASASAQTAPAEEAAEPGEVQETPAEEAAESEEVQEAPAEEAAGPEEVQEAPAEEAAESEEVQNVPAEETAEPEEVQEAPAAEPEQTEEPVVEAPAPAPGQAEESIAQSVAVIPPQKQPLREIITRFGSNLSEIADAVEQKLSGNAVGRFLLDALDLMETVLVSCFVMLLLFTFVCGYATVDGDSMFPTLNSGERLLVSRLDHSFETGDILILNSKTAHTFNADGALEASDGLGKCIVKRLIAVGGQTVHIDFAAGVVYVDDRALDEPYTSTLTTRDEGAFSYPLTVPEGYVFVLGDNRSISKDSRHPDVGLIPESDIVGSVWLRFSPFRTFD